MHNARTGGGADGTQRRKGWRRRNQCAPIIIAANSERLVSMGELYSAHAHVMLRLRKFCSSQLASSVGNDFSMCSEETLSSVCLQWEALVISEEAEQELLDYMTTAGFTLDERLSEQMTRLSYSEIVLKYISPQS